MVASTLGVRVTSNSKNYLGLLMMVGRFKSWVFAHYLVRFRSKVDSWSLRFLSAGGHEVMIKSVLQALSIYMMQVFLFPKLFCSRLEKVLKRFWGRILDR